MWIILLPFSWLYGLGVWLRNRAFDRRWLHESHAPVPVISVGNLTAGGTGKTPLVEYLVALLRARGRTVGVARRGYGRRSRGLRVVADGKQILLDAMEGGDEPVQIARKFPGARVVVAERRIEAVQRAVDLGADVVVLDDGFQHRYVARDLDILVADVRMDLTREPMLPAGMRREPLHAMGRAAVLALSHAEDVEKTETALASLARWFVGEVVMYHSRLQGLWRLSGDLPVAPTRVSPAFAFSGIGDHDGFVEGLRKFGVEVRGSMRFQDHHVYGVPDIHRIHTHAVRAGATALVTTEKDATRLRAMPRLEHLFETIPLYYTRTAVEMLAGAAALDRLVVRVLEGKGKQR